MNSKALAILSYLGLVISCLALTASCFVVYRSYSSHLTDGSGISFTQGSVVYVNRPITPSPDSSPPVVQAPPDHPPETIIAGASSYHVIYTTKEWLHANQCVALTDHSKQEIIVYNEGARDIRFTMMHELMHVARHMTDEIDTSNNTGMDEDHNFIEPVAPELLILLRDNPKLVSWLTSQK